MYVYLFLYGSIILILRSEALILGVVVKVTGFLVTALSG